jgi:hypothetical protein
MNICMKFLCPCLLPLTHYTHYTRLSIYCPYLIVFCFYEKSFSSSKSGTYPLCTNVCKSYSWLGQSSFLVFFMCGPSIPVPPLFCQYLVVSFVFTRNHFHHLHLTPLHHTLTFEIMFSHLLDLNV